VGPAGADSERADEAVELLRRHGDVLRRVARRHSLCPDDADDALQRASLILLTKSPAIDPGRLIAWMVVVTKHEAMAVRRGRERLLACLAPDRNPAADPLSAIPCEAPDPAERAERAEHLTEARAALAALKASERLAIVLQAQGYSYAEICEICGWSYTKVNRCLAEGRQALREHVARSAGRR
jgi:RNA polymerase sigma factor (sigma-70 family)